jgi:hypothetical protein
MSCLLAIPSASRVQTWDTYSLVLSLLTPSFAFCLPPEFSYKRLLLMPMAKMNTPFLSAFFAVILPWRQINDQIKNFFLIPRAFARIAQSGIEFLLLVPAPASPAPRFVIGVKSGVTIHSLPLYLLYNNFFLLAGRRVGKIFLKRIQFILRKIV